MAKITIIGAGMMGSALAFPARENGNDVSLVGTHLDREIIDFCKQNGRHPKFIRDFPDGIKYYHIDDVLGAIDGADLIIGGVSSFGVDWFGEKILPLIPDDTPVLTVTKGLYDREDGELVTYPALWRERLVKLGKRNTLCAVGGPCTSYELVAHDQTEVAFCGDSLDVLRRIKRMMATDYYHISLSRDVTGIESAVALKNGYALAVALTIGMNRREHGEDSPLHYNSQAAVFGQALREMQALLEMQNAGTTENLAVGIGDLYVTVYGGRTRMIGILLGEGYNIDDAKAKLSGVTLESLVVAERVARAVRKKAARGEVSLESFPLLLKIDDIINNHAASIPWEDFTFER